MVRYNKKNIKIWIIALSLLGIFVVGLKPIYAGFWDVLGGLALGPILLVVSWILYIPIYFWGFLISSILIPLMVWVANYNGFIYQPGVTDGWMIVRDLANMFVVVGMLVIAMGTLFNVETYSYKKLLPKLILAAIVINFSKMIMGFMIDISQVITLTFVKAFSGVAAGNIVDSMGLGKILSMSASPSTIISGVSAQLALIASLILGIIILVIVGAIMLALIAYFVGRIIILWIAIVLSPLLFVMPLLPMGDKFSGQVWQTISKNLISGPVLAFFLWLSFSIMEKTTGGMSAQFDASMIGSTQDFNAFFSKFGTIDTILNFILVAGLLMTSLMMASQLGAAGGKFAGEMAGKLQDVGSKIARTPGRWAWQGTKWMGRRADEGQRALQRKFLQNTKLGQVLTGKAKQEELADERKRRIEEEEIQDGRFAGLTISGALGREGEKIRTANNIIASSQSRLEELKKEREQAKKEYDDGVIDKGQYDHMIRSIEDREVVNNDKIIRAQAVKKPIEERQKELEGMKSQIESETSFKPNDLQYAMGRISESGLSMNIPKVAEGVKAMQDRRYKEELVGISGLSHDVASAVWHAPWKPGERKTREFAEEKSAMMEIKDSMEKETEGETDLVMQKLVSALKLNDRRQITAALSLAVENVDANEILKAPALDKILPFMEEALKNRPVVDSSGNEHRLDNNQIKNLIKDIKDTGGVRGGYMNHLADYFLTKANNGNEDMAARYKNTIGFEGLAVGNPWLYGNSYYDSQKGKNALRPVVFDESQGRLMLSKETIEAQAGKMNNLGIARLLQKFHPNALATENKDGEMGGLHETGMMWLLKNLNSAVLSQIKERPRELRADFILKLNRSDQFQSSVKRLEKKLSDYASGTDVNAEYLGYKMKDIFSTQREARSQLAFVEGFLGSMREALYSTGKK